MTQSSRPQADNISNYPAPSDPGPYSADQWAQIFQIFFTSDQQATQGPFVRYLNELECADNGTNAVTVDTGAGMVNGHALISSEQETFAIPAGPAAGRTDRVVMVENNTNTVVTQTTAGRPLLFPNDLSEYTGTPGVPPYSARLAIVRGADGAGTPAIDQTNNLYMVELYRYDIENTPTISNATDYRDFCHFSGTIGERSFFVQAVGGLNETDNTDLEFYTAADPSTGYGLVLPDSKTATALGHFSLPADYASNMTVEPCLLSESSGNVVCVNILNYGADGENVQTHVDTSGPSAVAIVSQKRNLVQSVSVTSAAAGDMISIIFTRSGADASDTVNDEVRISGWLVEYKALD